jgi:hypothetical protein
MGAVALPRLTLIRGAGNRRWDTAVGRTFTQEYYTTCIMFWPSEKLSGREGVVDWVSDR